MPDTNEQRDPAKEARELLAAEAKGEIAIDCRFGDHSECADTECWCDCHDRIGARAPELLRTLCDEVERLRALAQQSGQKSDVFSDGYAALGHDERDSDA